jgi:hypothetical protein
MTSSAYTYTKVLKNWTLLVHLIQVTFRESVENYDYDPGTSTFTVTFPNALTEEQKVALDIIVNSHIDTVHLSGKDVITGKMLRAYRTSDQILPTTLNTVSDILFQNTSQIHRQYFQMSASGKYIHITKPGIYAVMGKVGASLSSAADPTLLYNNTVIQWSLAYDDTRTGVTFITLPNANTYTTHSSGSPSGSPSGGPSSAFSRMCDSTKVSAILNVTAANGTYIKLTAKVILGNAPLMLDNDTTTFSIISLPGLTYYEGNMSSALTMGNNMLDVPLGSDRIIQYPFVHTVPQPLVKVSQAGLVLVLARTTFNKISGTDRSACMAQLVHNGVPLTSISSDSREIVAPGMKSTSHFSTFLSVSAGDTFSLQGKVITGTALQLSAGETGLIIMFLHPCIMQTLTGGNFITSAPIQSSITAAPRDIVLDKRIIVHPFEPAGIVGEGTNIYTTTCSGYHFVDSHVTFENLSGVPVVAEIHMTSSVDGGKTFHQVPGSSSSKHLNSTGRTTVHTFMYSNLPENSKVKVQASSTGTSIENVIISSAQLTIFNPVKVEAQGDVGTGVFGSKLEIVTAPEDLRIAGTAFEQKCRLKYHFIPTGVYRIGAQIAFATTEATTITIELLDIHSTSGSTFTIYSRVMTVPAGVYPFSSVDYFNLAEGEHVLLLQANSVNNIPFTAKYTTMESWRAI